VSEPVNEPVTVGEVMRQLAHLFDRDQFPDNKWTHVRFYARRDSNGKIWVDKPEMRLDDQ
jgi:hypothetical protein